MKKNKTKKNKKLNIYIPNLKEKELLIAHYFCEKSKKDVCILQCKSVTKCNEK